MVGKGVAKKKEIRAYIRSRSMMGCCLKQIFADISAVYGSNNVSYDTFRRLKKEFYSGLESIENAPKSGRPKSPSPSYNVMTRRGYNGPRVTAEGLAQIYDDIQRQSVKVLDVGAGTGLVAEELRTLGFEYIDALEPSDVLVERATEKAVYQQIFKMFLTGDTLDLESGQYDAVVSCGAFIENHIPPEGINEIIRLTKPGGHVVITTRLNYLETVEMYKGKLEPYMERQQENGKWKLLSRQEFPNYYNIDEGITWIFQVLSSTIQ